MRQSNRIGWAIFFSVCYIMVSLILLGCSFAFWPLAIVTVPIVLFGGVGAVDAWAKVFRRAL